MRTVQTVVSYAFIYLCVLALYQLPGCAESPVTAASDLDQRAYALYGTFVIVEEQGAQLDADPKVPATLKAAIRTADAKAKPTADILAQFLEQYQEANAAVKAGTSPADKLNVATQNLTHWIVEAQTDINSLVNAVHAVPGH